MLTADGRYRFACVQKKNGDPLQMIELLNLRYASCKDSTRISELTNTYQNNCGDGSNMAEYIGEYKSLFDQLDGMGKFTATQDSKNPTSSPKYWD